MDPMHECRGLCLASAATRKGDPSAWLHRPTHRGSVTSYPYTPRHAGCAALFAIGCALFYPGRQVLSYLVIRNQITALAGNASTVSLCGTHRPVRRQWSVRPQSAFGHTTSIAHTCKTGKNGVLPHVAIPPRACMRGTPCH